MEWPAPRSNAVTSMAIYMHATIELKPGSMSRFNDAMDKFVALLEAEGWRLEGAFHQRTGKLRTVIDIWRLESLDHYERGLKAVATKSGIGEIKAVLDDVIQAETVVFMDAAPFMHTTQ